MNNIKKHIFIIGMMCSGKSSLAPILSKKLNIPFIDLDKDLISILGIDIQEMFDTLSEKKFNKAYEEINQNYEEFILDQKNKLELLWETQNKHFINIINE